MNGFKLTGRTRQRLHLAPVYTLLLLIIIVAIAVSVIWKDVEAVDRFGPNIASESIGILLTVLFVRKFLEQSERARRLRASVGGLRKAGRSLQDLADTWAQTFKGCMQTREPDTYVTMQELLAPGNSELLMWCDPRAVRRPGSDERWVQWSAAHMRDAQHNLDQIVATYGGTLDAEYIEALDELIGDPFLKGFGDLASDAGIESSTWRVALNSVRALRMAHFERLLATVRAHNQLTADVAGVRNRSVAPRTSMLGVSLAPDHDLRVDTELDDGWWRSTPAIGALRMNMPNRPG